MDEEDSGELLKSTVEALPLLQTLRMLSASHSELEEAGRKVSQIATNIDALEISSSDVVSLLAKLESNRQQQPQNLSSFISLARELVTSLKFDAEHGGINAWRLVAENVREALAVNDLDSAHQSLQELRRFMQDNVTKSTSTIAAPGTANLQAVLTEFSQQIRQEVIIKWSRMQKLDLSLTLKLLMIMKSLGRDTHAELRVLFLECRSQVLETQIAHFMPSRLSRFACNKSNPASASTELSSSAFVIKLIELHRSFLLDIVTQYNSLLLAEPQQPESIAEPDILTSPDMLIFNENYNAGKAVLFCWLDMRLAIFRQLVAKFLVVVDEDDTMQRMESIYSQLMYFGLSLARIYYDTRLDFVPLVEKALMLHVDGVVKKATDEFTREIRTTAQRYTTLLWLLDATAVCAESEQQQVPNEAGNIKTETTLTAQQQLITNCKLIFERFCRQIQQDALGPVRSCALQTLGFFVHRRVSIEALGLMRKEVKFLIDAVEAAEEMTSLNTSEKRRGSTVNNHGLPDMAAKVERHVRECVEICYPLDELQQQQLGLDLVLVPSGDVSPLKVYEICHAEEQPDR